MQQCPAMAGVEGEMKLTVEGMTCGHCARAVGKAIEALGGSAQVDLEQGTVEVSGVSDEEAVRRAIEDEGYTVLACDA
ncbi:heavy-metal-associated domain-containing protein [Luteimonas sp. e5]